MEQIQSHSNPLQSVFYIYLSKKLFVVTKNLILIYLLAALNNI